ncbi:glycogen synthase GlgA [Guggenheimella bovis]
MKIYFAASESAPYVKTGGLADVASSLPKALAKLGHDVRVVIPLYSSIPYELRKDFTFLKSFYISIPNVNQYVGIFETVRDDVHYYFVDNEYYFARSQLYGFGDDGERFAYFCRAILEVLVETEFYPDIIHLNDWHTAAAAALFKDQYVQREGFHDTKVIFTIHNLKYQGIFPYSVMKDQLGLGDRYFTYDKLEYFGNLNFMKAGIAFSDFITTVSKTYASEIQYSYYAEGLHSMLLHKANMIRGITNGIDYESYNPETDDEIFSHYKVKNAHKKANNKVELQKLLGLKVDPDIPMVSVVSRIVSDKGMDLIDFIFEELMEEDIQFVLLGTGDKEYEDKFIEYARHYKSRVSTNIFFSESLARKIYAGSDIFLMPSRFEPCGLSQLIAMRYGTIPVVRQTGGLNDTVIPYNRFTGAGTGFGFVNYNAHELLFTIKDALYYYSQKDLWERIRTQAMNRNSSWDESAKQYVDLYHMVLNDR